MMMDRASLLAQFNDSTKVFKNKSKDSVTKTSSYDRKMLIETVYSLMEICENLLKGPSPSVDEIANACMQKTKEVLVEILPKLINPDTDNKNVSRKTPISADERVLIVENSSSEGGTFTNESWTEVVNRKISKKLKNIPVVRNVVNKNGKGCLILPSEETLNHAKTALEDEFTVQHQERKINTLMPRLKIHNFTVKDYSSKELLLDMILDKNTYIKDNIVGETSENIAVTYMDTTKNYAVLKITPRLHDVIMRTSRIFVGLESAYVTDYFHVTQCYHCQGFGHIHGSERCKQKDNPPICMYCAGSHRSSECRRKNCIDTHRCTNCAKSTISLIKSKAKGHTANSRECPLYVKELARMKSITNYEIKN